jgi:hypothetical protein
MRNDQLIGATPLAFFLRERLLGLVAGNVTGGGGKATTKKT